MGQKLWGVTAGAEDMPNWLTEKQKKNTFADNRGWILRHPSGIEEILVSIAGLNDRLGGASPSLIYWDTETYYTAQSNRAVYVEFNEKIDLDSGTPTVVLTGGSSIDTFNIVNGGTGYTTATLTVVGDGFNGQITPTLVDGVITDITIDNAGSGYRTISVTVAGDGEGAEITLTLDTPVEVTATFDSIVGTELNTAKFLFQAPNNTGDWLTVLPQTIAAGVFNDAGTATASDLVITSEIEPVLKEIIWD